MPNGYPESFRASIDVDYGAFTIPRLSRVLLDADGGLSQLRLAAPHRMEDLVVAPQRWACFYPSGDISSVPLAEPATVGGLAIPRGSILQRNARAQPRAAFIEAPIAHAGLTFARGKMRFHTNGTIDLARIETPGSVGGYDCAAGALRYHANGSFRGCKLAANTTLGGVKVRPGVAEVSEDGKLVRGVLDQAYQLGTQQFQPGQRLNGLYLDEGVHEVRSTTEMNTLVGELTAEMDRLAIGWLLSKARRGAFGNFDRGKIALAHSAVSQQRHAVVTNRHYRVEDFLKNPPFDDCDCTVEVTLEVQWRVHNHELHVFGGIKGGSLIVVDCNFCPVTNIALAFLAAVAPPIQVERQRLLNRKLQAIVGEEEAVYIATLTGSVPVIGSSVRVKELYAQGGRLLATYQYTRRIE